MAGVGCTNNRMKLYDMVTAVDHYLPLVWTTENKLASWKEEHQDKALKQTHQDGYSLFLTSSSSTKARAPSRSPLEH
ncbi:hypothetical protein ATANTOWER_025152 [Ataeniobius toweri]|uniref:Uncharacterized protein n=1 Tax=Ataeniobius toweri TaxID=208326 RepID=A0ABU7AD93_9TELE|nr:hypothetical protein [Ataeniobius toweri]